MSRKQNKLNNLQATNEKLQDQLASAEQDAYLAQQMSLAMSRSLRLMGKTMAKMMPVYLRAERQEARAEAERMVRSQPTFANWALKPVVIQTDGVTFTVTLHQWDRKKSRETDIDFQGRETTWTETTNATAYIKIDLGGFFDATTVHATLTHTEQGDHTKPGSKVTNVIEFSLVINDQTQNVRVESIGTMIQTESTTSAMEWGTTATLNGKPCSNCGTYHGGKEATVRIK